VGTKPEWQGNIKKMEKGRAGWKKETEKNKMKTDKEEM
jgi:hypothetical protein